jgi:hypothetical protein
LVMVHDSVSVLCSVLFCSVVVPASTMTLPLAVEAP